MKVTKVKNVNEAVELALRWKTEGKYNWFRGQTHPWDIVATFLRRNNEEQQVILSKVDRFFQWLESTSGLEAIAEDEDKAVAIAQHYGIPTTFIDFTTNPRIAGFFATDGENLEIGQDCYICCLNTDHLSETWNRICASNKQIPKLEFLTPDVDNLWRLEAQEGVFLYCPILKFEQFYSIDRISFPFGGRFEIPREKIYPVRKSPLEILLDQFFTNELALERGEILREMFQKAGVKERRVPSNSTELDKYFFTDRITKLDSWSAVNLKEWLNPEREKWESTTTKEHWEFEISFSQSALEMQIELEKNLISRFAAVKNFRRKLVDWSFRFEESINQTLNSETEMQQTARRIFDGMRILPYTDEEIAQSISTGLVLTALWLKSEKGKWEADWKRIFDSLIPDSIEIEISSEKGASSRGFVNEKKLFYCTREDLPELIKPEFKESFCKGIIPTIQFIIEPDKLYDFQKLRSLFVEELIPTQSVIRDIKFPVYFTPARISVLGLP